MTPRFFTVRFESMGREYFAHIQAVDNLDATAAVMARNTAAISAQVVREINASEWCRLTGRAVH